MMRWISSVSVAVIVVTVLSMISTRALYKELIRIAGALIIIYAVLSPLGAVTESNLGSAFSDVKDSVENRIKNTQQSSKKLQFDIISGKICEYIESKATAHGLDCTVKASAFSDEKGNYVIEQITVNYQSPPSDSDIAFMTELIEDECGVPADKQRHDGR